ncbi:MAG: hypothetical protein Q9163_000427 [Psora crenata]
MPSEPAVTPPFLFSNHDANLALLQCLSVATPKKPALPLELILQILEHRSRWVCTYATAFPEQGAAGNLPIRVSAGHGLNMQVILSTPPLSSNEIARARSVVFTFTSKDQGWSSYPSHFGTYENTWTWFEAGLRTQPITEHDPSAGNGATNEQGRKPEYGYERFILQRNRHAGRVPESYRVELGQDSPLFAKLKAGDVIDLVACAQYAGWENQVHEAGIQIWSFHDLVEDAAPP